MGNFNRDNRFNRRDFGRRDFERPQLFKVVCNKCGKDCEVPFKPTGSRPIFCRDCFKTNGGFDANRSEGRNNDRSRNEQPNYGDQFAALNAKLDRILKILTPTVYEKVVETITEQPKADTIAPEKKKRASKKKPTI